MTKIDWKPIATLELEPFSADKWFVPGAICIGATNEVFIGMMRYIYNSRGVGKWKSLERVQVYPTHWAEMPNLPE